MRKLLLLFAAFLFTSSAFAQANGTVVGSPTFGAAKFGNGLTAVSDSNYVTLPVNVLPTSSSWTIDLQVQNSTGGALKIFLGDLASGGGANGWFGQNASGYLTLSTPSGDVNSTFNLADGAWHHIAATFNGTNITILADGAQVGTSALSTPWSSADTASVGRFVVTGYAWPGKIDELAFWSIVKYTNGYTVPTAAYGGSESGLVHLYHFEADATDSASSALAIAPNNAAIIYSPFNWNVTGTYAGAVNTGAYFYTIFSGTSAAVKFDLTGISTPYPQMWCQIDNDAITRYTLASTVAVAAGLDSRKHALRCTMKSSPTTTDRWNAPVWKFTGLTLDGGSTVTQPVRRTKNILCYGTSISEGVYALGTVGTSADFDDGMSTYCSALSRAMDAEVGLVAFSSQGVSTAGTGNVPALPSTYNYIYSGVARSFSSPAPDLVIYEEGTNDSTTNIVAAYTGIVNGVKTAAPNVKQLLLCPFGPTFCTNQSTNIQSVATATGTQFVSTTGWFNTADSNDGVHPYGYASTNLIAPMLFPIVNAALYPARSYSFF